LGVDVPPGPDPDPGGGEDEAVGVAGGVAGAFGAVMVTAADAFGTLARSVALAVTVSRTDFTAAALTGTVSCAWSWRGADFASIAPRSHRDVPSAPPQPKLNPGASPAAGVACSWMTASGTLALRAQTLTVQRAGWPRSTLRFAWTSLTQRLAGTVCATVLAATLGAPPPSVRVGAAVGVPEPDGPVLGDAEADPPALVGVGLAVGEPLEGGGDLLGGVTGGRSGSQDWLAAWAVRLAADAVAATAVTTAQAAVSRAPPATRAAVAGCPCAKRMRTPASAARYCSAYRT
jgi:hypothetical protein